MKEGRKHSLQEHQTSPRAAVGEPPRPPRLRAFVIGAVGALAACVVVPAAELILKIQIGICQFAPAAIGIFLVIVGANYLIHRLRASWALHSADMVIVYTMIVIATLTSSRGLLGKLIPTMVAHNYFNTVVNKWDEQVWPHIPQWMTPWDVEGDDVDPVAQKYYEGLRQGETIPWRRWVKPLGAWYVFTLCLFLAWTCLASILRRQWVDNEKLTFPLTQPPLELVAPDRLRAFFCNKLMWLGFLIPAVVFAINGLHQINPLIPDLSLQNRLNTYFIRKPWSDMSNVTLYLSFAAIGFSYFLPTQLLFSLWVFYWFARLEDIIISLAGMPVEAMPRFPTRLHTGYQIMGAYCVLLAHLVRTSWPHLRAVWDRAFRGGPDIGDADELMGHRWAVLGLFAAIIGAVVWLCAAGVSLWLAFIEVTVYVIVVGVVMGRSVSEAGMMMTETSFRPLDMVRLGTPLNRLSVKNLAVLAMPDSAFVRDLRGNLLSPIMDALKMADATRLRKRTLLPAIAVALLLVMTVGAAVHLYIPYTESGLNLYQYGSWNARSNMDFNVAQSRLAVDYDLRLPVNFAIGVGLTLLLSFLRSQFWWWPLYPIGFALCGSWTMIVFWFPILLAWVIKTLMLRYAGMSAYHKGRPFFLGMILGEFFMAVFWTVFCSITRHNAPFFPWP